MHLVYGQDSYVVTWVCGLLDMDIPHLCSSIGISDGLKLIGGAVYSNQYLDRKGKPFSIEISFGTVDVRWGNRAIISALLGYPFVQLKVKRVQSTVSRRNRHVRQFLERLGFKLEGVGRQAWPQGGDACVYSMLSGEFFSSKWMNHHRQVGTLSPSSTRSERNLGGPDQIQQGNGAL